MLRKPNKQIGMCLSGQLGANFHFTYASMCLNIKYTIMNKKNAQPFRQYVPIISSIGLSLYILRFTITAAFFVQKHISPLKLFNFFLKKRSLNSFQIASCSSWDIDGQEVWHKIVNVSHFGGKIDISVRIQQIAAIEKLL